VLALTGAAVKKKKEQRNKVSSGLTRQDRQSRVHSSHSEQGHAQHIRCRPPCQCARQSIFCSTWRWWSSAPSQCTVMNNNDAASFTCTTLHGCFCRTVHRTRVAASNQVDHRHVEQRKWERVRGQSGTAKLGPEKRSGTETDSVAVRKDTQERSRSMSTVTRC